MDQSSDNAIRIRCLVEGDSHVFNVDITANQEISNLKEEIQRKRANGILKNVDPHALELWNMKVSTTGDQ